MRIIENRFENNYEITCPFCTSILEITPEDVTISQGQYCYWAEFVCLLCKKKITLDSEDLPKGWTP